MTSKEKILKQLGEKYSEEELETMLNEEQHNEKKLSYYGKALCEVCAKKVLPHLTHRSIANELHRAIDSYMKAEKKI